MMTAATTPHKLEPVVTMRNGNPASAQPIAGLGPREIAFLTRKKNGFGVAIEPAGQGLAREVMRKASI
jgi:hypothetical protein